MIAKITTPTVAKIIKKEGVFRFFEEQKLSQVLADLKSSHDAVFVFDKVDKFLGVISLQRLIKKRSLNDNSKLKSAVFMPPKMLPSDSLKDLALHMIESSIYFLPVVDDEDNFLGIATINRLFSFFLKNPSLLDSSGHITLAEKVLVTITDEISISQAISIMRKEKVAKLPVINGNDRLIGIISQYDLQPFIKLDKPQGNYDLKGEKKSNMEAPVKNYMQRMPVTINHMPLFAEAVNLMNHHNVGSIMIVDKDNRPMDILTKKDLLQTIAHLPTF